AEIRTIRCSIPAFIARADQSARKFARSGAQFLPSSLELINPRGNSHDQVLNFCLPPSDDVHAGGASGDEFDFWRFFLMPETCFPGPDLLFFDGLVSSSFFSSTC